MNKQQQEVAGWMQAFGQEVPDKVTMPSLEVRKLRARLILEEALETVHALGINGFVGNISLSYLHHCFIRDLISFEEKQKPNLAATADGIADSLVVQLGTAVACGIDIEPIFNEVMRSNWSKMWTDDELNDKYPGGHAALEQLGLTATLKGTHPEVDIDFYIVKDKSGKVIKSPSYSPANLVPLLTY